MGFPAEDSDIKHVMETIDLNGDGEITLTEFQEYVSRLGGIQKLFENRQKRTMRGSENGPHLPRTGVSCGGSKWCGSCGSMEKEP